MKNKNIPESVATSIDNKRWDGKENWIPQSREELAIRNILRDVVNDHISIAYACGEIIRRINQNGQ